MEYSIILFELVKQTEITGNGLLEFIHARSLFIFYNYWTKRNLDSE